MHLEALNVAFYWGRCVELTVVEAFVERLLPLAELELQLEAQVGERLLAGLDTCIILLDFRPLRRSNEDYLFVCIRSHD